MTINERQDIKDLAAAADVREERLARRIADLYARDPQFVAAKPDPAVVDAARRPGIRLAEILQIFVDGYADRPALGLRAREFVTPIRGAIASTEVFHAAVRAAKVGADKDIPHVSRQLIDKYVSDLQHLGVI